MIKQLQIALLITIFSLLTLSVSAQRDLIITQAGEEIRCKILDETPTRFVYAYLSPKNKVLRNEIFKNLVGSFKYNHYDSDVLKSEKMAPKPNNPTNRGIDTRKVEETSKKKEELTKPEAPKKPKDKKDSKKDKKDGKNKDSKKKNSKDIIKNSTENSDSTQVVKPIDLPIVQTKVDSLAVKEEIKKTEETKKEETKISKKDISPLADAQPRSEFSDFMKFRVGVKGGLGNLIKKNSDTSPIGLYREKLNRGWMFGFNAEYFIKDNFGVGFVYTNYQSSNKKDNFDYPDLFTLEPIKAGSLSNKVSHKFVGPTFVYRKSLDFKTFAVLTVSPGMHLYSDKGVTNASNFKFKGKGYGAEATLGLDFLLGNDIFGRDIILSLEGGYNYGQIKSLNYGGTIGTKTLGNPIDLSRLDFSVALRFTRFPMYLR
jgi:hypothetical protein